MNELLSDLMITLSSRENLRRSLRVTLYRNAIYLIGNQTLTVVSGLVFWLLVARLYSTEDVGLGSATVSAMMLLTHFALLGLDYAIIRFLPKAGNDSNDMINSCLLITALASVFLTLVFVSGLAIWSPELLFLQRDPVWFSAFIIFTVSLTMFMFLIRVFVATRRAGHTLAMGTIFNILRLALVVSLGTFVGVFGIYAAWGIGQAVACGIGVLLLLPRALAGYCLFTKIKRKIVGEMMRFSFTNYIAALLWFAPTFILPLMVVNLIGAELNAYFYIAWAIANILFMIPMSVSFSLFAEGSHDQERLGRDSRRSLLFAFSLLLPLILLTILAGDKILALFAPDYAEEATQVLQILAVSAIPVGLNQIYFGVKRVEMKMKSVVGLTAFIAIATLALSWVLLPRVGIIGVGIAWLSSQCAVASVITVLWLRPARKRPLE